MESGCVLHYVKSFVGYRVYVDDKPAAMINGLSALVHGLNPQVTYK